MSFFKGLLLAKKKLFSSASAERRKKEKDCYLKNGSCVLEELLALCDGNCRIPIRYYTSIEIHNAIRHSKTTIMELADESMVTGSLDNRPILVRFNERTFKNIHRDIAITAQMSHLKNVLRLVGCCLEFEEAVMVYEYIEDDHVSGFSAISGDFRREEDESKELLLLTRKTLFSSADAEKRKKEHDCYLQNGSAVLEELLALCDGNCRIPIRKTAYDIIDRVNSKETTDIDEEDSVEEDNFMDSVILEETIDFKNFPTNFVDRYIKESNVVDIADPTILEEHGIEIQQQLEDYLDLVKKCTTLKGDDRPYIIHVARELC
ncbi:serine/threonine-protein kinase ZRK3-like [Solanum verrucosum]|uniref:serine/threonine-protein kinase ZRK3-like n=1 Tax=Solanum verrucosum TaxID=315347 RepID=UPI0020D1907A|nr:serine/threonine-protein kinase ZRK3-like [Solanum verrucosum]